MLKGALHIHSNISPDSNLELEFLRRSFKDAGYHFIMSAEHAEDLSAEKYQDLLERYRTLSDNEFLIIPGLEIKWQDKVHFLAYGAKEYMANIDDLSLRDAIRAIRGTTKCDFLVWGHFNHPARINGASLEVISLVDGLEVFNVGYHSRIAPDYVGMRTLNRLRSAGKAVVALGGLDLHRQDALGSMCCMIEGEERPRRGSIVAAFKEGRVISQGRFFALTQSRYTAGVMFSSLCVTVASHYARRLRQKAKRIRKRYGKHTNA